MVLSRDAANAQVHDEKHIHRIEKEYSNAMNAGAVPLHKTLRATSRIASQKNHHSSTSQKLTTDAGYQINMHDTNAIQIQCNNNFQ